MRRSVSASSTARTARLKTAPKEPVAYLGGLAIYLAFLLALAVDGVVATFSERGAGDPAGRVDRRDPGVWSTIWDQLGPWTKLAGQLVAVWVLIKSGYLRSS